MDALNPLALYQEDSLISSVSTDETKFAKLESEKIDEMSSEQIVKTQSNWKCHLLKLRIE